MFHPSLLRTTALLVVAWLTLSFGWYGLNIWIPTLLEEYKNPLNDYEVGARCIAVATHSWPLLLDSPTCMQPHTRIGTRTGQPHMHAATHWQTTTHAAQAGVGVWGEDAHT
jgi:hypothetical protein